MKTHHVSCHPFTQQKQFLILSHGYISLFIRNCFVEYRSRKECNYTGQTSKQTVWIDILKFNMYFIDFPCTIEYMMIKDTDIVKLYCGTRVPWKYYSISSTVNVTFISDIYLPNKGEFQLFFQEGNQVLQTTHIFQATLTDQKHLLFYNAKRDETQSLYFVAYRIHILHLNISSCLSRSHNIAIYDGPDIRSPQKRVNAIVTLSAFIMLLVVTTKDSNTLPPAPDCQPYLIRYKSTYEMKKCAERFYPHKIGISIKFVLFPRTERCTWNVPSYIRLGFVRSYIKMLTVDDKGAVERPETLLDDEHCIYGGIYIYSKKNDAELQEVYSKCRKGRKNTPFEFMLEENTNTVITAVVFYPYSKIVHHDFIYFKTMNFFQRHLVKYKTRIDNCSIVKGCIASTNSGVSSATHTTQCVHTEILINHFWTFTPRRVAYVWRR